MFSYGNDFKGYAVVDLETTGLRSSDRIVEVGVVLMSPEGEITDVLETLIQPLMPVQATNIHGITDEMVEYAPTLEFMVPQLLTSFEGRKLSAHNANFEARFLNKELEKFGVPIMVSNFVDTLKLSRKFHPKAVNHKLHTLAGHYGWTIDNPHQAISDAYATAIVLQGMLEKYPASFFDAAPLFINEYENDMVDRSLWVARNSRYVL